MSEQDERLVEPDAEPEGGPPSGEPGDDHPVEEVPEWR